MMEPLGGQPPAGSQPSVDDLSYQVSYQRALEAVLWAIPAVALYRFRAAAFDDLGLRDNDILAMSNVATPKLEALTANSSTPYISAFTDLQQGPVVLDLPASGPEGSLYGQVVDAWQLTIADVGPSGLDKGRGGKYLFTPPGFKGEIPEGYLHVPSPNYRIAFAFRSIVATGKTIADAYAYAKRLRMYYLTEADSPPEQRFFDPLHDRYPSLPFYDERFFDDVAAIFTVEPVLPQDKVMMGMMASLGIQQGVDFIPDGATTAIMRQAAIDAWYYLQNRYDHLPADWFYYPDRQYVPLMRPDANNTFSYVYDDRIDLDGRAMQFFWCTYVPKVFSARPATFYLMAMADAAGNHLEAGKTYRVTVPPDMPIEQFWSLTIYDRATFSFIYTPSGRTSITSTQLDGVKVNDDGSITLYTGPDAPEAWEGNWIDTAGKRPLPCFRFYGGTDPLFDKSFVMPDFEEVK